MVSIRRKLGIGCAGLLALLVIALGALLLWRSNVDRKLDAAWRRALGGASFPERFRKTGDNATVLELERLGAEIGIDMAPHPPEKWKGRVRPSPGQAARFRAVSGTVKNSVFLPFEPEVAPPGEVAAFLVSVRPALERTVQLLVHGEKPVWHRDLSRGFDVQIPNWLGPLQLQRLLLLEARERLRGGEAERVPEVLEATWRLYEAVRDEDPLIVTQLIAQILLKLQQPVLRELPATPALVSRWRPRLTGLDLRERSVLALQAECFGAHSAATSDRPLGGENLGLVPVWFGRWMIWDYSRRCQGMFARLAGRDVRTYDAEAFFQEQLAGLRSCPHSVLSLGVGGEP